jgi:hypothetical protein
MWEVLIANHLDLGQIKKQGSAVRSYLLHSSLASATALLHILRALANSGHHNAGANPFS